MGDVRAERVTADIGVRAPLHEPVSFYISSSSATTITEAGTYYKAAGTTTQVNTSRDWTYATNKVTYDGLDDVTVIARATISSTCASGAQTLGFRIVKNNSPTDSDAVATTVRRVISNATDIGATAVEGVFDMSTDDYLEVFTTNETTTANVTLDNMHFTAIANLG